LGSLPQWRKQLGILPLWWYKKKWEASNLRGFPKIKRYHKKKSLSFMEEILYMVARHKVYLFLDGFLGYHQIMIASKDKYKIAFIIDWGTFVWIVMPFELKNVPPTYQRPMCMAF
jgi:hypothetical protein